MDTLLDLGLRNALGATVLAVLAAGLGRLCPRPALRHSLWLLVLLKLLTPPLWPVALPRPPVPPELVPAEVGPPADAEEPLPADGDILAEPAPDLAPAPPARPALPGWKPVVLVVWLAGSLLWWSLAGVRLALFGRLLRYAVPAPAALREQADRLAARLGIRRGPGVWLVPAPVSPMLWALGGRPRLLLPAALWQRLDPDQRDTLLAHELAHLRRRDHWVRRLELLVLGLYWWHPVVWWARRELREAEEQCCDAWVVWALPAAARAYATALLETVTFLSQSRPALPATASGAGHVRRLKRRLTMILRGTPARSLTWGGLLAVLALAVLLLPLWPTWAESPGTVAPVAENGGPKPPPDREEAPPLNERRTAGPARTEEPRPPTPLERARAEQIQELKDAIELLEVQREIKMAEVRAAAGEAAGNRDTRETLVLQARSAARSGELKEVEVRLKHARRKLEELEHAGAAPAGSAHEAFRVEDLFDEMSHDVGSLEGGGMYQYSFRLKNPTREILHIASVRASAACAVVRAQPTELAPGETGKIVVHLDTGRFTGPKAIKVYVTFDRPQAAEAVLTLQAASRGPGTEARPADPQRRLRDMEQKLNDLLKEIDALKREMRPPRPDGRGAADGRGIYQTNSRDFKIPLQIDPARAGNIKEIHLYVSRDAGKTWQQVATLAGDAKDARYRAPEDGTYWFTVNVINRKGDQEPATAAGMQPMLVVDVDTNDPK